MMLPTSTRSIFELKADDIIVEDGIARRVRALARNTLTTYIGLEEYRYGCYWNRNVPRLENISYQVLDVSKFLHEIEDMME